MIFVMTSLIAAAQNEARPSVSGGQRQGSRLRVVHITRVEGEPQQAGSQRRTGN